MMLVAAQKERLNPDVQCVNFVDGVLFTRGALERLCGQSAKRFLVSSPPPHNKGKMLGQMLQ